MAKDPFPLDTCKEAVARRWGNEPRTKLGDTLYEALLNSALVILSANQDESIEPATIVRILRQGRTQIIEEMLSD